MVKKYIDVEELIRRAEKEELQQHEEHYKDMMQEIPNFNHENQYTDKRVYENKGFIILKVKSKGKTGYIIHNTKKPFKEGHSHLKSFEMSKVIINNVILKKTPKTSNMYLLESHIRLSDDKQYISYIKGLMEVRKCKKGDYVNRTSDKRR